MTIHFNERTAPKEQQSAPTPTTPDLLTVREVARTLRVDDSTVRRWVKAGALDAVRLPHRGKRVAYRIKSETMKSMLLGTATSGK